VEGDRAIPAGIEYVLRTARERRLVSHHGISPVDKVRATMAQPVARMQRIGRRGGGISHKSPRGLRLRWRDDAIPVALAGAGATSATPHMKKAAAMVQRPEVSPRYLKVV
jgi:hypothetical protein